MAEDTTTIYDTLSPNLYKISVSTYTSDLPANQVTANSLFSATVDEVAQTSTTSSTAIVQQQNGGTMAGKTKFDNSETGYILGIDSSVPKFYIGNTTNYLNWTGTQLIVSGNLTATTGSIGGFTIGANALYAGDGATKIQLDTTQGIFLGANTFINSPFRVALDGTLNATNATFTNVIATGTINAESGYLASGCYIGTVDALLCESEGLNIGVTGHIRGGQTDYDTGLGFFLGYSGGDYKFSVGNSAGDHMNWDGTHLILKGSFDVGTNGLINNSVYTVANLPVHVTIIGYNYPSAFE